MECPYKPNDEVWAEQTIYPGVVRCPLCGGLLIEETMEPINGDPADVHRRSTT